jgi:hypothetical protein
MFYITYVHEFDDDLKDGPTRFDCGVEFGPLGEVSDFNAYVEECLTFRRTDDGIDPRDPAFPDRIDINRWDFEELVGHRAFGRIIDEAWDMQREEDRANGKA